MNINLSSHSDTHHVTNCIHEHYASNDKIGGTSFQSTVQQQNIQKQPQTLGEAINELAAISREADSGHKILGRGNSFENSIGDEKDYGDDSIVMLLPDDTTDVHARNKGNLQVSPDMLNTLLTLKVTDSSILDSPDSIKVNAMGGMSGFDTTSERHLYNKRKQFIQKVMNGIKKHMSNWLHSLPEKLPGKENKKETIPKEMKAINNKDYILDTYDQTGQYKQMRKTTLIKDTVNKKV